MAGVRMLHFLKDWWKFIQIHQYYLYTMALIPLSTRPHQDVVWQNNSRLGFLKIQSYVPKAGEKGTAKYEPSFVTVKCCRWLIGSILGEIICESSNWQHIQRLKITRRGTSRQLFRLERIARCSIFTLSTQNIRFYWYQLMSLKKFMLRQSDDSRDVDFLLRTRYLGVYRSEWDKTVVWIFFLQSAKQGRRALQGSHRQRQKQPNEPGHWRHRRGRVCW